MKPLSRRQKVLIIIGTCAVLLLVIAWVVIDEMASAAVRREVAKLEAKGESLSWDVLAPPEVPDEENAALIYMKAFPLLAESGSDTENVLVELLTMDMNEPWDTVVHDMLCWGPGPYWTEEALTETAAWRAVRQRLKRNEPAFDQIHQAAAMEQCRFPVNYRAGINAPLPHLSALRTANRLFSLRMRVRRRDGDWVGAYDDILTILRAERATRQPNLVCHLVGTMLVAAALDELKTVAGEDEEARPETWRRILGELAALDRKPFFVAAMHGERATGAMTIDMIVTNPGLGGGVPKRGSRAVAFLSRPLLKYDKVHYLRYLGQVVDAAGKEPWEALTRVPELETEFMLTPTWARYTCAFAMASAGSIVSYVRYESRSSAARVALALRLYKHQHGAYPDALSGLVPGILKMVPKDPCSGKPLVYRRTETGFIVYSVGVDQVDNGGNDTPPDESERDQGVDIVWQAER